jgi:hypothetical protein
VVSRLCLIVCRVDEERPDELTQLQRFDLPETDVGQLTPETALDQLEAQTLSVGQQVMRSLLEQQWKQVNGERVAAYRRRFPPSPRQG